MKNLYIILTALFAIILVTSCSREEVVPPIPSVVINDSIPASPEEKGDSTGNDSIRDVSNGLSVDYGSWENDKDDNGGTAE
ncbi:MAG: hypothetical protein IKX65_03840 [Prevotella sp.]|nr:hypothetical protein [Prevotella sp.]